MSVLDELSDLENILASSQSYLLLCTPDPAQSCLRKAAAKVGLTC
jgi:hypothetical protein